MKKTLIALMIAALTTAPLYAEKVQDPMPSVSVMADLNKPLNTEKPAKIDTASWIFVGVIVVVAISFGAISFNTRTPL